MYYTYVIENLLDMNKLYVGYTNDPKIRWSKHILAAKTTNKKAKKYYIHRAMNKQGLNTFSFSVIESYASKEEALQSEIYWISYLRNLGFELYNLTDGGECGLVIGTLPPWTNERRLAASERNSGINNYFYGKQLFREANGNFGKPMQPHVKQAILDTKRIFTDQQIEEIRKLFESGTHTQTQLSQSYNVSLTSIHCIVKYKKWNNGATVTKTTPRLTTTQVLEIRNLYETEGYSAKELAKIYNLSVRHIFRIINRERWKDI